MARADQLGLTSARNLRQALAHRPTQGSRALLLEVIGDVQGGAESSAERRYIRDVEVAHRLPRGRRQASGRGGTRRNNVYDETKVIVEIDGRVVRGYWPDVAGGQCELALELEAIFRSRGWSGRANRCRRRDCPISHGS